MRRSQPTNQPTGWTPSRTSDEDARRHEHAAQEQTLPGTADTRPPVSADPGLRGTGWSFVLSYLVAGVLLATLVWAGGLWNLLANSRILDLLMRSGVVAFTDADQ